MAGQHNGAGGRGGSPAAIELRNINKSFGAVHANKGVSLKIQPGTIHGVVGENGAGKSTLMNILFGLTRADAGQMFIDGEEANIHTTADAIALGIGMVHQHFMLVPNFTVLENIMLGTEGGMLLEDGRVETRRTLYKLAQDYGMSVDAEAIVGELPVGLQQRVEIIKALKGGARILILDEPTGVLTPQEADSLFKILKTLKADGVTIVLISHKLAEIMAVTDNVSIMRNGGMVGHRVTGKTNPQELAELMVGRKVLLNVDKGISQPADVCLEVAGLHCASASGARLLSDISFEVRAGEILGIAGVAGNGQSELLEVLAGMRVPSEGTITILGRKITASSATDPQQMRSLGVAHIPEDRHKHGLVLGFEARENSILGYHNTELCGGGYLFDRQAVTRHCRALIDTY
ncbi:MAG: ABC transporter ATP-binding protein, partial [Aestuariivirgaceae bacterium]